MSEGRSTWKLAIRYWILDICFLLNILYSMANGHVLNPDDGELRIEGKPVTRNMQPNGT